LLRVVRLHHAFSQTQPTSPVINKKNFMSPDGATIQPVGTG
jgi:hypothetical protein